MDSTLIWLILSVEYLKVLYWNLIFLIYINDLHLAIKYSEVHHFADDTKLIHSSVNFINEQVSRDLKNFSNWLGANKIFLNSRKTACSLYFS